MDHSPPGSTVHEILQGRILECILQGRILPMPEGLVRDTGSILGSGRSPGGEHGKNMGSVRDPRIEPVFLLTPLELAGGFFTTSDTWEAPVIKNNSTKKKKKKDSRFTSWHDNILYC